MASVNETTHPPLFRRHARRPRLTRLLDESTAQAILVTAPAGYGKTTLAAEWLQGREDVVWYRATAASADLAAFSADLADVLAPLVPGIGERLRQRLRVADVPEKAVRPLAGLLAKDLDIWPKDALLVIDDYHLVADSTPVEEFVDWLLTLTSIRILVTTRRRPIWASARRILYGEVTEIGRDQLAMTHEEAGRVLDGRSSEAVKALVTHAEGWPALIGLAALSTSSELPEERVSEALFRYFAEEVFRREPEDVQEFMLLGSLPAALRVSVAREALDISEPHPVLGRLLSEGTLQETESGELRFHPLLREFLRRKFEFERPEAFADRATRVIQYARSKKNWSDAFELAIQANRPELAAEIAGEAAPTLLAAGRIETLEKWLGECQAETLGTPSAALAKVEVLTRQGRLSAAASLADGVLSQLPKNDSLRSRACFLAGQAMHLLSEDERALRYHTDAHQSARTTADRASALWGCFLAASELEREDAAGYLDELSHLTVHEIDGRLRLAAGRVLAGSRRGDFSGLWEEVSALVPLADYATDPMVKSSFLARAGELNVALANYLRGKRFLDEAVRVCTEIQLDFATALCLELRAIAEIGLRKFQTARHTLANLERLSHDHEDPYLDLACRKVALQLALSDGRDVTAASVRPEYSTGGLQRSGLGEYHALVALAAASAGAIDEAKDELEEARAVTKSIEALFYSHWADLVISFRASGYTREMVDSAATLLHLAIARGFAHSFVLAYRACPDILELLAADTDASRLAWRVMSGAEDETLARSFKLAAPRRHENPSRLLTAREVEVLRLLAEGLSNAEIAERLVISRSTAKVHVHHILEKAGAANRLQAVRRLEGLLDEP
jgi:LuxR family transcriptional regulator, maltose regulon positive regulatory protein